MQFRKFASLIGMESFIKIQNLKILVIGIGGVGSYAAEALARSGIRNITILDEDVVDLSNINRQIHALRSTVGFSKVEVMGKRIKDINPLCIVNTLNIRFDKDTIDSVFKNEYDFVIDAIDTITSKILVINYCLDNNIKFISSMGHANKLDPTKIEIDDIRNTSVCPVARIIRNKFKDKSKSTKIPVCYSTEYPIKNKENKLYSSSFVPSTAGLIIASYVVNSIIKNN